MTFQDSDFAQTLLDLHERMSVLDSKDQQLLWKAIKKVCKYFNDLGEVRFGVCHRDFTPWNTCIVNGELYVFDWEYAKLSYPDGLDEARFFVEVCRQEQHF